MSALTGSVYFGAGLSIIAYWIGVKIQKKTGLVVCNSLLIAGLLIVAVLKLTGISYEDYNQGGSIITLFLAPATACLAVTIYSKIDLLKKYWLPVAAGCLAGTLVSMGSILLMCRLFGLDHEMTMSLLPKSVTTAIGVPLSELYGGMGGVTTAAIIVTGIFANMMGPTLCKLFHITDPAAQGVAFGTAGHVIGTAKANEVSPLTGAVSSLSLVVAGLLTAVLFPLLAGAV